MNNPNEKGAAGCPTCATREFDHLDPSCVFGCGTRIDPDHGFCRRCGDHSANQITCPACGTTWEDWRGTWEITP